MKQLSTIGRFTTPVAMVVFLTYEISRSMQIDSQVWTIAIIIGAALTAVGVEVIGILSGHTLEGFWRINDTTRAWLSFGLLTIYTTVSTYIMWGNQTLRPIPLIAALVYIVSALAESLNKHDETAVMQQANETSEQAAKLAFDLEQATMDREFERKRKIADMRLKHEAKLAKLSQTAKPAAHTSANHQRTISEPSAKFYECACGKVYENSRAYNGHKRHCKVEPVKVSQNGVVK